VAFWMAFEQTAKPRVWVLAAFYGCIALAVWTKGLIGLALPLSGLIPYCALDWKARPHRLFRPIFSAAAMALLAVLCVGAFFLAGGRDALYQFLWVNQILRFVHPVGTGHAQPFYYYLEMVPLVVLPWLAPFAGLFTRSFWRERAEGERNDEEVVPSSLSSMNRVMGHFLSPTLKPPSAFTWAARISAAFWQESPTVGLLPVISALTPILMSLVSLAEPGNGRFLTSRHPIPISSSVR